MTLGWNADQPAERTEVVTVTNTDGVAVIALNRPDALNAVNAELATAFGNALEEADHDSAVAVMVITGTGRAFCAGADLKALGAGHSVAAQGHPEWGFAGFTEHYLTKPVIAAVNGYALGGGTEIVLACDLAVLSVDAALGLPEIKRGLMAGAGGLIRLPRQLPVKLAMEAALTGEPLDSATALRWGLVNRVTTADRVLACALELASQVASGAPLSARNSKKVMHHAAGYGSDWDRAVWKLQDAAMQDILASADSQEGTAAFTAKRTPVWNGR